MPLDKQEDDRQLRIAAESSSSYPRPEGPVSIFAYSLAIIIMLILLAMMWGAGARIIYETFMWSWRLFGF